MNEDEKESFENKQENTRSFSFKKRHSLLKRTASEPKLIELESKEIYFCSDNQKESAILNTDDQIKNQITEVNKSKTLNRPLNHHKKSGPEINCNFEESNSSFKEIFFYHFENILIEFLDKKHNLK